MLPYNPGWGSPYYQLTPYDEDLSTGRVTFGKPNPCPGGCLGRGAQIHSQILFYPMKDLTSVVTSFKESSQAKDDIICEEVKVNDKINGVYCSENVMSGRSVLYMQGEEYTYGISGHKCSMYYYNIQKGLVTTTKDGESCQSYADSISIDE